MKLSERLKEREHAIDPKYYGFKAMIDSREIAEIEELERKAALWNKVQNSAGLLNDMHYRLGYNHERETWFVRQIHPFKIVCDGIDTFKMAEHISAILTHMSWTKDERIKFTNLMRKRINRFVSRM